MNNRQISKEPLIKIVGVKKYFPLKKTKLFQKEQLSVKANDGIDLVIYKGETVGLVGESGCGKSTLGRLILQLYPVTSGKILYYGYDLDEYAPKYFRKVIDNLDKNKIKYLNNLEKIALMEKELQEKMASPEAIQKVEEYKKEIARLEAENERVITECKEKYGTFIISNNMKAVRKFFKFDSKIYKFEVQIEKYKEKIQKYELELEDAKKIVNQKAQRQLEELELQLKNADVNQIADLEKQIAIARRKSQEHIINVDLKIKEAQNKINIIKSEMRKYISIIKSSLSNNIDLNSQILADLIKYKEQEYNNSKLIKKYSDLANFQKEKDEIKILKEKNEKLLDYVSNVVGALFLVDDMKGLKTDIYKYVNAKVERSKLRKELEILKAKKHRTKVQLEDTSVDRREVEIRYLNEQLNEFEEKIKATENRIIELQDEIKKGRARLDEILESVKDHELYYKLENNKETGIDLARLTNEEMRILRKDIQIIFQDPYSSLNPRMTVGQIIYEGMQAHGLDQSFYDSKQDEIIKIMEKCGLAPYMLHRYPHQFSGGQRQRIGIARALSLKPQFVVCDEAVSALDVSIQSQIINLLEDLREQENLTYLFISHDLSVIKHISDRIGVMYLGNLVELGESDAIYQNPLHPYTKALISSIPTTEQREVKRIILEGEIPSNVNPPSGCKFRTRCPIARDVCAKKVPELREVEPGRFVACHFYEETKNIKAD